MAKDRQVSQVPQVPKGNESWGPDKDSQQKGPGGGDPRAARFVQSLTEWGK